MGVAKPEREKFWRKHVDALIVSDVGVTAYCRKHGLSTASLYTWRRRLAGKNKTEGPQAVQLVPVEVVKVRNRGVEASFSLAFPELGSASISGDYGAVVRVLQILRWEAV